MATQTQPSTRSARTPYRLTARQFRKMIEADIFREGERVELLGGILDQMTTNPPHVFVVAQLAALLRPILPMEWSLWEEKPVDLGQRWRPQPDISVLSSPTRAFTGRLGKPSDILMLVEVSDTTYSKDSVVKRRQYARAAVPQYWIVDLERRQVEVHNGLQGRGKTAGYHRVEYYQEGVQMPVVIDGRDLGVLAVKDLLP